ncbi:Alb1-domain-containing protein [Paraphoma chrysanthemicola]|uniref:Alb1-domain-containing protein n=1 Tax=Paraphoma chrysanthemicola TaxID=798071 RepID=A0A8K0R1X2_9PLEO|nr:Alb1-domain-containing protein [Paraphoma chrysanthemicola]
MAKTAKVKKRQVTVHSRAARRAASPSIDLDKKLKQTTRDSASPSRPAQTKLHALSAQNAGIQKKAKKSTMTRAQRLRHQKGLERAAAVLDKRQVKVVKSLDKEKTVKERSKGWEDVNGDGVKSKKGVRSADADPTEQAHAQERDWVSDEDMDGTDADADAPEGQGGASRDEQVKPESKQVDLVPESVPLPVEEDELL